MNIDYPPDLSYFYRAFDLFDFTFLSKLVNAR